MQLYLIRHTTPAVPPGVCYGQSDIDVASTFFDEVHAIHEKIAHLQPVASYSSPLSRCSRLASSLRLGETVHDERLMELDFGEWEMQAWDDLPREQLDRWSEAYTHLAPPGGETYSELQLRASEFLREQLQVYKGQDVVAVTHAGVIRSILAEVLNLPLSEVFRFHLDYGGVTQIKLGEQVPVVGYVNR